MDIALKKSILKNNQSIAISGSKSETNRLLLLQKLYPNLEIINASFSDDSKVMMNALTSKQTIIDVHHAGTAMRFLTAYYAIDSSLNETILTGSSRMKERPIKILVDALKQLDVTVSYLEKEGFPPIKIKGQEIVKNKVNIPANVSSQYISALILIAPKLQNGLEIELIGKITSLPYLEMTLAILQDFGIETHFKDNIITIKSTSELKKTSFTVESDWSSASYFFSFIALSAIGSKLSLSSFKKNSLQGDAVLIDIYKNFGVQTTFEKDVLVLEKIEKHTVQFLNLNLNNAPDIAQTIAVTCLGLNVQCNLKGLHTLKIKETDRLQALKNELEKFGAIVEITDDSLKINNTVDFIYEDIQIETYQDHRMAMAFAPLALKQSIIIKDSEVVSKSYPAFWEDLDTINIC
ncbi:3-phosphoshikimate 1-carboxyvinyltransferase [Flavobacterium sp. xlx-214]|uniref:3-phosphoshikimate 1-carboxyvinyltransferase n=1 Tax=unclassified Flavobacterium TaxID=196869 RepID=UPI0013D279C6|nr:MULTISPECIES: 3-phosphoshikimate 1-carboxyvinyltransferase [unclassified Flavobacterium]MBA5792244.1 3-phosphoshikimate 1-carboxyvinyltransferase [Flavobacterium sp. xlx-221]QMI82439.1 3-phosphoshikimate 1-carboxyvinyltransferase [Flavobacterium sp. xlx-214]